MALKKVGSLWKKDSKNNQEYLTGTLDMGALGECRIMVFPNEKKTEKQPDFTVSLLNNEAAEASAK